MPYLYTAVRDGTKTGLPIMRALWLHYPDDPTAVARGDQYLWGRDILVAPVVEKGATSRRLYLPKGTWYDFWTEQRVEGGQTIERAVDLGTMPLYVRAGAVIPMGPVKQYTEEPSDEPMTLVVYPGTDGVSSLYEDDGHSFDYRTGLFSRSAGPSDGPTDRSRPSEHFWQAFVVIGGPETTGSSAVTSGVIAWPHALRASQMITGIRRLPPTVAACRRSAGSLGS